jgi:hypothetical protein
MNEKYLWKLWAKCKHPHPKHGGGDMVWPMEFAELIVQECVAICQDVDGEDNIDARSGRQDCAVEIREHFGVEE